MNNNHRDCFHTNTKQARSICRKVSAAIALAESLDLQVRYADIEETDTVRQVTISEGDAWWMTRLTITWSSTGVSTTRFAATTMEKVPSTHLLSWVSTLAAGRA